MNPYNSHLSIIKLIILRLDSANKPSLLSEGVTEIWINNQSCKGINLITWHKQARRTPRVIIVHDAVKVTIRAHLTVVHVFHVYASTDTPWVAHVLSHYTSIRYGRITYVSMTHDASQFEDSICLICVSTFQMLVHSDPTNTGLKWQVEATTLELRISDQTTPLPSHPVFSIFL
jgi:hypothetical protein